MKPVFTILGALVIVIGGFLFFANTSNDNGSEAVSSEKNASVGGINTPRSGSENAGNEGEDTAEMTEAAGATVVVRRTADGFEPKETVITVGDAVSFVNGTDEFFWPASDVHPTHRIYSELDPREPIGPGESWEFTFTRAGEWRYHDHLRANVKGTVVVVE